MVLILIQLIHMQECYNDGDAWHPLPVPTQLLCVTVSLCGEPPPPLPTPLAIEFPLIQPGYVY